MAFGWGPQIPMASLQISRSRIYGFGGPHVPVLMTQWRRPFESSNVDSESLVGMIRNVFLERRVVCVFGILCIKAKNIV